MSSATLSTNHTWLECLSTSICCSIIAVTTIVRTFVASRSFSICFQNIWSCFWVSTLENPINTAHYLAVNFFRPVSEYPTIALVIFIALFAPHTKNILSFDNYIYATAAIFLHLWNSYFFLLELAGLKLNQHHVIFRFPFFSRTQTLLLISILI